MSTIRREIVNAALTRAHNLINFNIYDDIHKEHELHDVERRYPAEHYVLVDDKLRILSAIKEIWGNRVTTVFPRQGHYAFDEKEISKYPPAAASESGVPPSSSVTSTSAS